MPSITAEDISFHYDQPYASVFEGLSFSLDARWRTGLVGRNGRGKTTLLGLLSGRLRPTRGSLNTPIRPACFPYTPARADRPTLEVIRDAVAPFAAWEAEMERLLNQGDDASIQRYGELLGDYEEHGGYDIDARIRREAAALSLDEAALEQRFDTLSGGQRTRALIAALFLLPHAFPLIDEPTNHLDLEGRALLGRYLARKRGFVLASHDRHFLDLCVDHVLSINRSDVRVHACSFSHWQDQMALEEEHERRRSENIQREVRAMERSARKRRGWSDAKEKQKIGTKCDTGYIGRRAALQMRRALAIERRMDAALEEKRALLKNAEKKRTLTLEVERAPERVLEAEDLRVTLGGRALLGGLSLTVERGERVAICGPNGGGKTTLLRALTGEAALSTGRLWMPGQVRFARAYQVPLWRRGDLRNHLREAGVDETRFRSIMGAFGVSGEVFERPLETFSEGQRKKVDLCRSFLEPAHLLIWDEPLNYVDLASREQIEAVILAHRPTMIFVEHDRAFLDRVATRIIEVGSPSISPHSGLRSPSNAG